MNSTRPVGAARVRRRALVAAGGAAVLLGAPAVAQAVVRLLVPYPPGGTTDQVARLLAEGLSIADGPRWVVDNRPGASGTLGTQALAAAAPDGRTFGLGTVSTLVLLPRLRDTGYHALRSFEPVGEVGSAPFLVVAGPALPPLNTLADLVALLRDAPGRYDYASVGEGSLPHVAGLRFERAAGVRLVHIPYPGAPQARVDLLAGRVHLMFDQLATFLLPPLLHGPLRPLALMGERRLALLPHVPTVAEAGLPGPQALMWMALLAPARTPAARVAAVNAELQRVLASAPVRDALRALGIEPGGGSPAALRGYIAAQLAAEFHDDAGTRR